MQQRVHNRKWAHFTLSAESITACLFIRARTYANVLLRGDKQEGLLRVKEHALHEALALGERRLRGRSGVRVVGWSSSSEYQIAKNRSE